MCFLRAQCVYIFHYYCCILVISNNRKLLEKSLSRAEEEDTVMNETEVLEKTLLKRRTDLREVESLLSDAEANLNGTRAKVCHIHTLPH